ncbi:MAG: hypothetical protein K0R99_401 [Microbacterium sp.]|jgi:hypothetical protein|uniref:hypothetical protein n=1 Tax=Microbacterium sp. TaxID=51671 RepID=UPI00261C9B18|nr:hypothetical protein [Microbacterium sp.]MDF2558955.1 hypothetical protein [Microbacterium sp.]
MIIVAAADLSGVTDTVAGALQSENVYVAPEVKGGDALTAALTDALPADGSIAVVVLPTDADYGAAFDLELLDRITREVPQKTVVLAIGDDVQAASTAIESTEALRIANENEAAAGGDTQTALVETVQQIVEETPSSPGANGAGGGADWLLPVVIGGAVLLAAGGTAIGLLARRRRAPKAASTTDPVPPGIRLRVNRLRQLRVDYANVPNSPVAAETASGIDALASHVEQLFVRLDAKAETDQVTLAEAEYSDKLARLVAALEPDYLLDLLTRPDLWDAPEERIDEVREALAAVTTQIVDNIKQVNARKGLLFQVSLDSLIGRSELRDWERQFRKNSGE